MLSDCSRVVSGRYQPITVRSSPAGLVLAHRPPTRPDSSQGRRAARAGPALAGLRGSARCT